MAHENIETADATFPAGGGMAEATTLEGHDLEYEVRGGLWEITHAILFYISLSCAILATVGVAPLAMGAACALLFAYTIFTFFSSPTYLIIDPSTHEAIVERYHYFIPSRRQFPHDQLERLEVVESPHVPVEEGESGSRRDLSYYVRIYLELKDGRRLKIFRSGMTGAPSENREKAFLVTQRASEALDVPVAYTRRGDKRGTGEARDES
jgi:hypothetical protein